MGCAEVISFPEVRASRRWTALRQQLHARFDQWLDRLDEALPQSDPTLAEVTDAVWNLRQARTGSVTEAIVHHTSDDEHTRRQAACRQCQRPLTARGPMPRTLETMVGVLTLERPSLYCPACRRGRYPLDERLGVAPGRKQCDIQQAATELAIELPYDTAQTLFTKLTGVSMGAERLHALSNQAAQGLGVLEAAPTKDAIARQVATCAAGQPRRPVLVLAIDGAHVPTRPEGAQRRRPGRKRQRAKRARWQGEWREAKGFRFYLLGAERIIHVLSWHQVASDQELTEALRQVKEAGLMPEAQVRMCVLGDGAPWIWKCVKALYPQAQQILDSYHGAEDVHKVAHEQYGASLHAQQWAEATLTRRYVGQVKQVLTGLRRMQPVSTTARKVIEKLWTYLDEHRHRVHDSTFRRRGYPLGSGGIESANKFVCHVRLKRSGAWWYVRTSNHMMALRCAKYNGTFDRVFAQYRERLRAG